MGDGARHDILVVLPHEHFGRMYLHGPVAEAMASSTTLRWSFATRDDADAAALGSLGEVGGRWAPLHRPFRSPRPAPLKLLPWVVHQLASAVGFYLHLSLVYRFNMRHGFQGFRNRLLLSKPARRLARREGHPVDRWLGFPAPRSALIERAVTRLYHAAWQRQPDVEALFDDLRPAVVVLATVQSPFVTPYALAARARGIPILGMIGTWDQPTTKGPVVPGVSRFAAPGRWTAEQIVAFHEVPSELVEVIGWIQMDPHVVYAEAGSREELLQAVGVPAGGRLIVFGAYTERLGSHEPAVLRWLAGRVRDGAFGAATLLIRPHPADVDWAQRLGNLADEPAVLVEPAGHGGQAHLAQLMRHADVVLSSAGTLCLDAAANGTPAIGLGFAEDGSTPQSDRPERSFEMEHYASVLETGAVPLATDHDALERLVHEALDDPEYRAVERAELCRLHLEPLDGKAGCRMVDLVTRLATPA